MKGDVHTGYLPEHPGAGAAELRRAVGTGVCQSGSAASAVDRPPVAMSPGDNRERARRALALAPDGRTELIP